MDLTPDPVPGLAPELARAMRSPALSLLPPPGLDDVVRGRARRVRRRRRTAGSLLGAAAVAGAVLLLPGVDRAEQEQLAGGDETHGIRSATSEVLVLGHVNGGDVVGYYQDDQPCVAAVRVKNQSRCGPGVNPATTAALPFVFPPDDAALRIDTRQLVAGVVGPQVRSVRVLLRQGAPLTATTSSGRGFALALFSVPVPAGAEPASVQALDDAGRVVGTQPLPR